MEGLVRRIRMYELMHMTRTLINLVYVLANNSYAGIISKF
jgi:hypothetical protein